MTERKELKDMETCGCRSGYRAHDGDAPVSRRRAGNLPITILSVLALLSVAVWVGLTLPDGGPNVPHTPLAQLELLGMDTTQQGESVVVTGRVRNIFNETLEDVRVTVSQEDENGTVMDVASSPIDEEVLQPARVSEFEVVFENPNAFKRWNSTDIKFHSDGLEILFHRKRS